jgi:hypothetical protein
VPDVAGPFAVWRVAEVHDLQVFQARLHPGLSLGDADVRRWLDRWPGRVYSQPGPDGVEVTLARRIRPRPRERWWLHLLLLALTVLTATIAGAVLVDGDPHRIREASFAGTAIPVPTRLTPLAVAPASGSPFPCSSSWARTSWGTTPWRGATGWTCRRPSLSPRRVW